MDVTQAKHDLRSRMRAVRAAIPPEERLRLAAEVEARLRELPGLQAARTVLLFSSFGTEIPTSGTISRLRSEGRRVLLPYLEEDTLEAAEARPGDELVASGYGPKEPSNRIAVASAEIDAVIVPGLAFDRRGHRLGYGGGHYDRYLRRLGSGPLRAGIGFAVQLVESVPAESGDERVDLVVTDKEVVECAATGDPEGPSV